MGFSYLVLSCLISTLIFLSKPAYSQVNLNLLTKSQTPLIVSPYNYPIINPYIATLSYVLARPTENIRYKIVPINLHPERANIPYYGNNHILNLAFFSHENNPAAPLIFIIPGLGGTTLNPGTLYLAELFYDAGYNVVTLPSSLSWQFSLSVSRTGFPGFSFIDAEDMLILMNKADSILRTQQNINPSKYALVGYSLGALDSSFVANLDLQKHFFNFERVLMINPPLQKNKSITALDRLIDPKISLSQTEQYDLFNYANRAFNITNVFNPDNFFPFGFEFPIGFSDSQLGWLIGSNFRESLLDVVLFSQELDDQNILKTPRSPFWRNLRKAEALTYNFRDYINQFLFPKLKDNNFFSYKIKNPNELISRSDMRAQLNSLSEHNVEWAIFHNQNDFIFNKGDLELLLDSNTESRIYPFGGHLGNLWFEQNRQDILNFLEPLI